MDIMRLRCLLNQQFNYKSIKVQKQILVKVPNKIFVKIHCKNVILNPSVERVDSLVIIFSLSSYCYALMNNTIYIFLHLIHL
jgi:hypothetical protein